MSFLVESLVFVSSGLLVPCVAVLFILLGQALAAVLGTLRDYRAELRRMDVLLAWLRAAGPGEEPPGTELRGAFGESFCALLHSETRSGANLLLAEYETVCEQRLASLSRMTRLGPMTGLLGTLIPMGPALDGLANGDVAQLAGQMQVAFTTTVIGLLVGGIGLVLAQRERHVINRQLAALDYLCDNRSPAGYEAAEPRR